MDIGGTPYAVRLRLDVPHRGDKVNYKDHKVTEIDIAPLRYQGDSLKEGGRADGGAISAINLGVLKNEVKPSRIENGVLLQSSSSAPR